MARTRIGDFAARWKGLGDEKQETQKFWFELLQALGYVNPSEYLLFEKRVKLDGSTRFIDVYIPQTRVIIEQKSLGVDLSKAEAQSGGDLLTPYNQARRYDNNLPVDEKARWIVCCNFESFEIHDMNVPLDAPKVIRLSDIEKNVSCFGFLTDIKVREVHRQEEISFRAGRLIGDLYDLILPQYADPGNPETLKSLNQLCVRLVFCLYAEDTMLFGEKNKFYNYLKAFNPGQFRKALVELFRVFDTPYEERDRYLEPELASFPYIRGGIFSQDIEIPLFTEQIIDLLLDKASLEVDWSDISPTVFGAVFESTLNPVTRRGGGMHYTSVENIHKVIDPLFLDDLKAEFVQAANIPVKAKRNKALTDFQDKLAGLKFLDPACGSGNFLTETYLSLRRLENETLQALGIEGMLYFGEEFSPIKVKIDQFYGIEINDFAVSVARTALWIAESQTMKETEHIVQRPIEYFPLRENPNIVEGNALRIDWNDVILASKCSYLMGNPPFVGTKMMSNSQKEDTKVVIGEWKNYGTLDYVACWYKKALDYIRTTDIRCAFVSTNSICQGEQVPNMWKPLLKEAHIDFAYRTFQWDSEASIKAHVHCIIVGFSIAKNDKQPFIIGDMGCSYVSNINGYLVEGHSQLYAESRKAPLMAVPPMYLGCDFKDDGNFVMEEAEKEQFLTQEPGAKRFIRPYMMGRDFITRKPRYCIWLKDVSPSEYNKMPHLYNRIKRVKEFRESCPSPDTNRYANTPTLPVRLCYYSEGIYAQTIAVPRISSQSRKYIPIELLGPDVVDANRNLNRMLTEN